MIVTLWLVLDPAAEPKFLEQPPDDGARAPGTKVYRVDVPVRDPVPVDGVLTPMTAAARIASGS
jgi:hypothetical protein